MNNKYQVIMNFSYLKKSLIIVLVIAFTVTSCSEEIVPKPKAFLRLAYTNATYQKVTSDCPYEFEFSSIATVEASEKCWINLVYPKLRASLNITYRPVENNLTELLRESEKLTYNHAIKADGISSQPFANATKNVYGALSEVTGNAASPLQFHLTDSSRHFITGALYFKVQPNYDSILPAIKYIEDDIKHLMETLTWKN